MGVALLASAVFIGLGAPRGPGWRIARTAGSLLLLAVLAWALGAAFLIRMIEHGAPDQADLRLAIRLGRVGALGMAVTVAVSLWLGTAVFLELPVMRAEIVPILPMAIVAAWIRLDAAPRQSRWRTEERLTQASRTRLRGHAPRVIGRVTVRCVHVLFVRSAPADLPTRKAIRWSRRRWLRPTRRYGPHQPRPCRAPCQTGAKPRTIHGAEWAIATLRSDE